VIAWDANMQALSGLSAQQVLGQPLWDVRFRSLPEKRKTPAIHSWLKQGLTQLLETGRWQVAEQPIRAAVAHGNGHEFDVELILSSLETPYGYRILGACLRPEPAGLPATATQAVYQSLIEHSLQGVVIFQGQRLVYANHAAAEITGYSAHELLSMSINQSIGLLHPDNRRLAWQYLHEWLAGRQTPLFDEYHYQHPDGSERWLQAHTALVTRQGKPALQVAFLDLTAHKAAQQALQRSLEQERRTREMMLALGQAAQVVQRARTPADVYRAIGEQVRGLGFHAVVLRLDPDGQHIVVDYATYSQEMVRKAEEITGLPMLGYRFLPPPDGYYARIVAEKRAFYDAQSDQTIAEALNRSYALATAKALDIQQRIGAPLVIRGQVRGILIVNGSGLREEDVPAVAGFANQAAIALENAALIAEDQRQKEALRALSAQLVSTQETEQSRIARELHDETGQTLTAMSLQLAQAIQELTQSVPEIEPQILKRLTKTRELVRQTSQQIRELCFRLRPSILDEMGLAPALRWLANWFEGQYKVQVWFSHRGTEKRLSSEIETTLYRIVQEGLTNVIRYAQAQSVSICLKQAAESVTLTIEDDGVGFDPRSVAGQELGESTGLVGMRERVRLVDGQIEIDARPREGTRIAVYIPQQGD
jgi:PAS domain S-box-containing protein